VVGLIIDVLREKVPTALALECNGACIDGMQMRAPCHRAEQFIRCESNFTDARCSPSDPWFGPRPMGRHGLQLNRFFLEVQATPHHQKS
jgi:hypothetical protein